MYIRDVWSELRCAPDLERRHAVYAMGRLVLHINKFSLLPSSSPGEILYRAGLHIYCITYYTQRIWERGAGAEELRPRNSSGVLCARELIYI